MVRTDFDSPDFPHGQAGYNHGCPCRKCCRANTEKCRKARHLAAERKKAAKEKPRDNVVQMGSRRRQFTAPLGPTESSDSRELVQGRAVWKPRGLDEIGRVEKSVIDQFSNSEVAQDLPSMVMNARTIARVLDDQRQMSQHATASRQLQSIIKELTGGTDQVKDKRKTGSRANRLGAIAGMTKVRRAQ